MSGGGLFIQTQNHPLKGYFVLLRWTPPPLDPGPVDHYKPSSEPALSEKSGGPGGLGMFFDFFAGFLLLFGYVLGFFDGFCVLLGWLLLMGASVG
ncbi:putative fibronectin type III [Helianthus annuus]|nr:putative fibronectin type III [Helianthus annuus]KAJ0479442.1 putative fibronectin type III [Helianthus annuus]KAJ0662389.1 putative fibronectin type III [Helianthus annuus]KAJ0669915.1 putative fibronectin type III [Helianthus annuus]KAJ0847699.1 putative fibronectin type III [Helianthus annuus]